MAHTRTSRAAAAAVALLGVLGSAAVAEAASGARATGETTVTSGRWAVVATAGTTAPTTSGPLVLSFARMAGGSANPPAPQYLSVFNTGTLAVTGATYSVASTSGNGEVPVLETCTATWNEQLGTCLLGTVTAITPGTATTVGPRAVGSSVRLRIRFARNVSDGTTVTVGAQVGRDQVRLATTTRS